MIDKGEKIPFKERTSRTKRHIKEFFTGAKGKLKGKGTIFMSLLVVVLILGMAVQNTQMIDKMEKLLSNAEGEFHEIYDDSKVIKAYKSGDSSGLDSKDSFVLDKLTEIIGEIITDDMTDYEKEKAVYDWQVNWTKYDSEDLNPIAQATENHTPYGVLKSHSAICVGNATTFKLFMDALDIPCVIIHSTESGEHAWNVVQLDEEWYHVDVTFDGSTRPGVIGYTNFNVPDSIKDDGAWPWNHDEIPAANGTKYCYILNNALECDDFYGIPKVLKEAIDNKDAAVILTLKDRTGFTRSIANYICDNMYVENGSVAFSNVYSLGGKVIYKFEIYDWSGDQQTQVPDDIAAKLSEIISQL